MKEFEAAKEKPRLQPWRKESELRNLREFRRGQNWNQEELADLLGISKSYLQALESSRGSLPDRIMDRLRTLQRALAAGIKSDMEKPRRHSSTLKERSFRYHAN